MSAGQFVGRVGGIAAALGVGVAILNGSAVAAADNDGADTSSRGGASAGASQSDSAPASRVASRKPAATQDSSSAPSRGRAASSATDLTVSLPDLPSPSALTGLGGGSAAPAALTVPAPAASVPAPSAAVTLPAPSVNAPAPSASLPVPADTGPVALGVTQTYATTPPSPTATTTTPYGVLGQWMVNKNGQVADWVGQPYCGKGSTAANCKPDTPGAKIMQEPINTIFVVKAPTLYQAEQNLNWAITISGFGSTPFSSIGYSGIVGTKSYKQFPRSGPLGLGLIGPLPFLKFQNGLIGSLLGIGPAYRDAPFWAANNHLRTFGGEPDGKGNFIFTASVSRENLDTTGGGLLPGHGFESYNVARQALVDKMVKASWISFASNMNLVQMNNAIDPNDPKYTTGDADGLAQVIGIGSLFGSAPVRSSATTRVA
jgi:hypothetical protein